MPLSSNDTRDGSHSKIFHILSFLTQNWDCMHQNSVFRKKGVTSIRGYQRHIKNNIRFIYDATAFLKKVKFFYQV